MANNPKGVNTTTPEQREMVRRLATTCLNHSGQPNAAEIARRAGLSRNTARLIASAALAESATPSVEFPDWVTKGLEKPTAEELIGRLVASHERKKRNRDALDWFPIKVNEAKPYGLLWFGDPHLDDPETFWTLLQRHVAVAARPSIYSANIGDTTNNWVGKLVMKYADQSLSRSEADILGEWFMTGAGIKWIAWFLGNHDLWDRAADLYRKMGAARIPVIDWSAKFRLVHPNGSEVKIDASHGRKGNSIWNVMHGTLRESKLGEDADLYVTGHTHTFGLQQLEIPERRRVSWLLQLRGYKGHGYFEQRHGYHEHEKGSAILVMIDPRREADCVIQCFEDVEAGADYLGWLRSR